MGVSQGSVDDGRMRPSREFDRGARVHPADDLAVLCEVFLSRKCREFGERPAGFGFDGVQFSESRGLPAPPARKWPSVLRVNGSSALLEWRARSFPSSRPADADRNTCKGTRQWLHSDTLSSGRSPRWHSYLRNPVWVGPKLWPRPSMMLRTALCPGTANTSSTFSSDAGRCT